MELFSENVTDLSGYLCNSISVNLTHLKKDLFPVVLKPLATGTDLNLSHNLRQNNRDIGLGDIGAAMIFFILTDSQIPWTMADRFIWHLLHVYYSNPVLSLSGGAAEASVYWFLQWNHLFSDSPLGLDLLRGWVTRHCLKWLRLYWQIFIKDISSISSHVPLQCFSEFASVEKKKQFSDKSVKWI